MNTNRNMSTTKRLCLITCAFALLISTARADEPIDLVMLRNPDLPTPKPLRLYHERLIELWLLALDRPEVDMRCQAAQEIAWAHTRGQPGLARMVAPLVRELERAGQHPSVALAAARTLITLDAKESAPALFKLAETGDADARDVIEPALARWNYGPAREAWMKRVAEPAPNRRAVVLAMRGLATVGEQKAVPRLRELVLSADTAPPVRLEAAQALGTLRTSGGEADADKLAADATPRGIVARLAGAWVLRQHSGAEAVRRLQAFVRDPEPSVAAVAVARLVALDPALVEPVLKEVLASPDANVRGYGVEVLFRRPSEPHFKLLGDRLADVHPDVRSRARVALRDLAGKADLRAPVIQQGERMLGGSDWRGREQAAVLLGHLDHKAAAGSLVERLTDLRPEAAVAAAWALRVLAVPDTLPKALDHFRRHTQTRDAAEWRSRQLSQLAQMMGEARYKPADAAFRRVIVKDGPAGEEARAAAMWALGLIHEGKELPDLAGVLVGRLNALSPFDIEPEIVRQMAAVALGRMKAKSAVGSLRKFYEGKPSFSPVSNSCGWAIEQITGEKMPPPGVAEARQLGWFLAPLP